MKKIHSFYFTLALLFLLVFAGGSSGCKQPPVEEDYIPDSLYPFFNFNLGSWFKFENDSTTEIDSCYVISNVHEFNETELEEENVILKSDAFQIAWNSFAYPPAIIYTYHPGYKRVHGHMRYGPTFWCFTEPAYYGPDPGSTVEFVEKSDSINWQSQTYYDVYHFLAGVYDFYYVRNIGVVHWNYGVTDTTWTLIDYHIN